MCLSVKRSAKNLDKSKCLVIFTYLFLRQNGYVYVLFFLFCDCISWYCSIIGKISIFSNLVHEIYAAIYIVYCSKAKVRFDFWSNLRWNFKVLFVNFIPDDLVWISSGKNAVNHLFCKHRTPSWIKFSVLSDVICG